MYNNYNSGRAGHGGSGSYSSGNSRREASVIPTAKPLPKDYMTEAGKAMEEIGKEMEKFWELVTIVFLLLLAFGEDYIGL